MTRRRVIIVVLAASVIVAGAGLAAHLGWFAGARPWPAATGWDAIPAEERASFDIDWPVAAGPPPVLRWLGHAGVLVAWHGERILVDPNLSDVCTLAPRRMERPLAPEQVGAVGAVLVTHAHYDHLDERTLRALPAIGTIVVPAGSEDYVRGLRADAAILGLAPGASTRLRDVEIFAVAAAHNGHRLHPLASTYNAVGYVLRAQGAAIYVAGDTGRRNDFEAIAREHRPLLAVLPIGAYAPSFPLRRYHLSPEDAVDVARRLGVRTVVPYHFGTFVLSFDRAEDALPRFAHAARRARLRWAMPRLLGAAPEPA